MADNDRDESLISHLETLRNMLVRCFAAIGIFLPFAFLVSPKVLDFLIKILMRENSITLNFFSPMEVFLLQIKLAFLLDIIICFPYIAKQLWNFILPALYEKERKFIQSTVFVSTLLFLSGVAFCMFLILPLIINFGMSFAKGNVQALFGVSNVINLALWLTFTFGLMFQIPLITHFLIKSSIISKESVSSKRPYVATGLLIFAALLTPPDIISQILLFVPTYMLFELGLLFSKNPKSEMKTDD